MYRSYLCVCSICVCTVIFIFIYKNFEYSYCRFLFIVLFSILFIISLYSIAAFKCILCLSNTITRDHVLAHIPNRGSDSEKDLNCHVLKLVLKAISLNYLQYCYIAVLFAILYFMHSYITYVTYTSKQNHFDYAI